MVITYPPSKGPITISLPQLEPYTGNHAVPWNYGIEATTGEKIEPEVAEIKEFLRIIKNSEFCVVEQLNKMPAQISILGLLIASEAHRNALLKILNEAHVASTLKI